MRHEPVKPGTLPLCDFCSATPAVAYPCADFTSVAAAGDGHTVEHRSMGAWLACEGCAMLIDADDYGGLFDRFLNGYSARHPECSLYETAATEKLIRDEWRLFEANRKGQSVKFG